MAEHTNALLALNAATSLDSIEFDELYVKKDLSDHAVERASGLEVDPEYSLDLDTADDGTGFRIRVTIFTDLGIGELRVTATATYDVDGFDAELTTALLVEYANEVALMHLLPYLRHAIADLTQRTFGRPLVMPIIQRGGLSFIPPVEEPSH